MSTSFEKFDLTGKTAYVTGGGNGLGYAMTEALARSGATVMIVGRRENVLKDAAGQISESTGSTVLYHPTDLADQSDVWESAQHAIGELDGVDIFVGNAALDLLVPIEATTDDTVTTLMQVNFTANVALARAFLPGMRMNKWGRVLFSSSITSHRPSAVEGEYQSIYCASKGALNAFTRALANEAGRDGVTANSLILGVWWTEMLLGAAEALGPVKGKAMSDALASMTSIGRLGNADELHGLVQLLASDAGSYITGTESVIDGGMDVMLKPMASA